MKLLFVGDTHGSIDIDKIGPEVIKKLGLNSEDVIIHCGDIGVPWASDYDEMYEYWSNLPCQVVVCLGNHENYEWIERQPVIEKYGVLGYQMADNMFAPKIGSIAKVFGKTMWFFPGAYSFDFGYRTLGKTLFKQELPLKSDSDKAIESLLEHGYVDFIISHDGPRSFVSDYFGYPIGDVRDAYLVKTEQLRGERVHTGIVLDELRKREDLYGQWYFGHHHHDLGKGKIRCLMEKLALWDLETGEQTLILPDNQTLES